MISWIQKYFQHHFKLIFAILLLIMVVPLIWVFNPSSGIGSGDRRTVDREFFGHNLATAQGSQAVMGDANLSASLQMGFMGGIDNDQLQQYAMHRTASLWVADQMHIPHASDAEITTSLQKLRMFAGPDGQFDAKAYNQFRENLSKSRGGLSGADVRRVISDDLRVEKVSKLLSGPGYVLPRDVKAQLERSDTTWTLATATADYTAFKPDIKPTDAELTKFFEENAFRYEIPPHVSVSYVEFPLTNFARSINVTDAEVRAYYDANPSRFPNPAAKPADAKETLKTNPDADFAAVRPQVQAALVQERAQKASVNAASDLVLALVDSKARNMAGIESVLASKNVKPKPLAPFSREQGPAELGRSPQVASEAFKLNNDRLVSDPVPTPAGAVVLFYKDTQPARKPLLAEVREKVLSDYVENEKRKRFVDLGKAAKAQMEARLKAGDTFEKAAAAASNATGLKLDVKTLAPFTLRTPPQDMDYSVFGTLEELNKGQVSEMVVNPQNGVFVYAADKKLPDLSESNPRYVETRNQLANYAARIGASAYISELIQREEKRSEPKQQ